jgi:hypothetical protein
VQIFIFKPTSTDRLTDLSLRQTKEARGEEEVIVQKKKKKKKQKAGRICLGGGWRGTALRSKKNRKNQIHNEQIHARNNSSNFFSSLSKNETNFFFTFQCDVPPPTNIINII